MKKIKLENKELIEIKCPVCLKVAKVKKRSKYCSKECRKKSMRKGEEIKSIPAKFLRGPSFEDRLKYFYG